ncbi:SRPBCC family protein [Streptacidiphilus neutrinimicus]|uniref:SRPBCC family protein n=1 Tax=Streptacidiphilus neutrinimicus TaxID=105420 RepID=UPI0005AB7C90|nr:SRPBCC family protein [Streptacidiphilus neutrinimicus]
MAVRHVLIGRPPESVWNILADERCYARWVPGTSRTEPGDGHWPDVGSSLRYTVRLGPWQLQGRTVVRRCAPNARLELEAHAGRLGTARIGIELLPWGSGTLVIVDEHPLQGLGGSLHAAPSEALLHLRHRSMLSRLARTVEARDGATTEAGRAGWAAA